MPAHRIAVTTRAQDLPKAGAGVDLVIRHRGKIQGHLALGRGGLQWYGRKKSTAKYLPWAAFIAAMDAR